MRYALVGLTCLAVGAAGAWAYSQHVTVTTFLRVATYNYRTHR